MRPPKSPLSVLLGNLSRRSRWILDLMAHHPELWLETSRRLATKLEALEQGDAAAIRSILSREKEEMRSLNRP